jgi:hypothetical protein
MAKLSRVDSGEMTQAAELRALGGADSRTNKAIRGREGARRGFWPAMGLALLALAAAGARAQEQSPPSTTPTLKTGITYNDQSSEDCEKGNENNPYKGMDPLVCHGVMAPTDSRGECSLAGMQVWKRLGGTCYYCQAINPPINNGIIVPIDQLGRADQEGYKCGVDQADACMAVCWRESGSGPYVPPPGTEEQPGGPQTGGVEEPGPGPQQGIPENPTPGQPPLQGSTTGGNPCQPFGPGGYDYCKNPTQPPGCVCSKSQPPQKGSTNKPTSNPINDAGQYLQGVVAGFGNCFKSFGSLIAGAGFFAKGDFVDAAKAWGLSPGQSIMLKTMYSELTTPVVGQNVSPYEQGVTAGRRLCAYAVVPGVTKAVGTLAKGAISPGSTFTNPMKGGALQDAVNSAPQSLANKWVQTPKGPVQLGDYAGQGSFASVFKYGTNKVMKLSKNGPETLGYGPDSIKGQLNGAQRLQAAGVDTPQVSDYQPPSADSPASLVADDVTQNKGSFQLSNTEYHELPAAEQPQVLNAVETATNKIASGGNVLLDVNPGNFTLEPLGNAFNAIIHDPDMVLNVNEINNLAADAAPRGVLNWGLEVAGQPNFLSQPFTAQSLTNVLNIARQKLITGITSEPSGTVPSP